MDFYPTDQMYDVDIYLADEIFAGSDSAGLKMQLTGYDATGKFVDSGLKDAGIQPSSERYARGGHEAFKFAAPYIKDLLTIKFYYSASDALKFDYVKINGVAYYMGAWLEESSYTINAPKARNANYKIITKTMSVSDSGTDDNVQILLTGSVGSTSFHSLSTSRNDFEKYAFDGFEFNDYEVGEDLLKVSILKDGHDMWGIQYILVYYKGYWYRADFNRQDDEGGQVLSCKVKRVS